MHFLRSLTFQVLACVLVLSTLLGFGLSQIATHCGYVAAVGSLFALLSLGWRPRAVLGAAATAERNTATRPGKILSFPLAAATIVYAGTMVALNADGNLVPAADTAALRVVGVAQQTVDNSDGAAGDLSCQVERGIFKFDNSATAAIDADDKGKLAYVEDDQTVAESSDNFVHAGRILEVDDDGVWIEIGFTPNSAAAATTVGAALVAIAGGESPTEAEHNAVLARVNELRADVLALTAKVNGG